MISKGKTLINTIFLSGLILLEVIECNPDNVDLKSGGFTPHVELSYNDDSVNPFSLSNVTALAPASGTKTIVDERVVYFQVAP